MINLLIGVCFAVLIYQVYSYLKQKRSEEKQVKKNWDDLKVFSEGINEDMRKSSESGKLWKDGIPRKLNPDGSPGDIIKKE